MLQLGHTAAAHLDEEGVSARDVVALQHLFAVLHQLHQLVPLGRGHREADESVHIDPVGRAVEHHGIAADDAVRFQLVDAAGDSGTGQRHLFGDLLHRHTGILCEEGENLAVQIVHRKSTPFEICYIT